MPSLRPSFIFALIFLFAVVSTGGKNKDLKFSASQNTSRDLHFAAERLVDSSPIVLEEIPDLETLEVSKPKKKKKKVGFFKKLGMLLGCVKNDANVTPAPKKKHKPIVNEDLHQQRLLKFATGGIPQNVQSQKLAVDPTSHPSHLIFESEEDRDHQEFFDLLGSKAKPMNIKQISLEEKQKAMKERLKKLTLQEKMALIQHRESCGKTILDALNQFRQKNRLQPLKWSPEVYDAIQDHTHQMALLMEISHDKFDDRFAKIKGIKKGAENVGMSGFPLKTDQEVSDRLMQGWIKSTGHRKNMLIAALTHASIDCVYSGVDNAWYATMFLVTF